MIDDKIVQQWMRDFDKEAKVTTSGAWIKVPDANGEILTLNVDEYLQYRFNNQ